jgi:hypothetical protein
LTFIAALSCGGLAAVADARAVKPQVNHVAPDIADPGGSIAKMPLPLATAARLRDLTRRGSGTFASTMRPLDLRKLSMSDFGDTDERH